MIFIFSLLLTIFLCSTVTAEVYFVPSDYPDIKSAVDASHHDTLILIAPGTYRGDGNRDILIDEKTLTILGDGAPGEIIIDVEGSLDEPHRAFEMNGYSWNTVQIVNMTFRNGYIPDGRGGAVHSEGVSLTIESCNFENNLASKSGGGVFSDQDLNCLNSIFRNNYSDHGGGLAADNAFLYRCAFENNSARNGGGAGFDNGIAIGCEFVGNSAEDDGGGLLAHHYVSLEDCLFSSNLAVNSGGALRASGSIQCTLENSEFINNSANQGGACMLWGLYDLEIRNCIFIRNESEIHGGGILMHGYFGNIENTTFVDNHAGFYGGAISLDSWYQINLTNSIFWENAAFYAPEFYLRNPGNLGSSDIIIDYCVLDPADVLVEDNCNFQTGNRLINDDPVFVDQDAGDLNLSFNSPCINNGLNASSAQMDIDGDPRLVGQNIDIGAQEFQQEQRVGANLHMIDTIVTTGEMFEPGFVAVGDHWGQVINLAVALEVAGSFFFYPEWHPDFTSETINLQYGRHGINLFSFEWPIGVGAMNYLRFWGAVLDPQTNLIIGEIGMIQWSYM